MSAAPRGLMPAPGNARLHLQEPRKTTMTKTASTPAHANNGTAAKDDWADQFAQLKARYPKMRDLILVALHLLTTG